MYLYVYSIYIHVYVQIKTCYTVNFEIIRSQAPKIVVWPVSLPRGRGRWCVEGLWSNTNRIQPGSEIEYSKAAVFWRIFRFWRMFSGFWHFDSDFAFEGIWVSIKSFLKFEIIDCLLLFPNQYIIMSDRYMAISCTGTLHFLNIATTC